MNASDSETAASVRDPAAALEDFCFVHPQMFLIPVDHLGHAGVSDAFAEVLCRRGGVDEAWVAAFNRAFAGYWERGSDLYARAPETWFPPRLQNICIVTDRRQVRPYHQPLFRASWALDVSDFDPDSSNLEFGVYQLLHAERLAALQDMPKAIVSGLSYWLTRTDEEIEQFCRAAERSPRVDASVFVHLAEAMPWIRTLFHPRLHPPPEERPEPLRAVREGTLMVPGSAIEPLQQLVPTLREDVQAVAQRYRESLDTPADSATAAPHMVLGPSRTVAAWMALQRPPVLVTDAAGAPVWDPESPNEVEALEKALEGLTSPVAESLQADLEVVARKTNDFMDSLRNRDALPRTSGDVERTGGVYLHDERRLVVYCLTQPGLDPRVEPAPAYHRLLLAARTIHEWGHLADAAGWLGIPSSERPRERLAHDAIDHAVDKILAEAPSAFRSAARDESAKAGRTSGALVRSLLDYRMSDYVSNMLARRYLHPSELEAYVRANVHSHFHEELSPTQLLARYAFEFQYLGLGLAPDPMRYFLETTWFSPYLIDAGAMSVARLQALFEAVGALCACYRVDETAFVS